MRFFRFILPTAFLQSPGAAFWRRCVAAFLLVPLAASAQNPPPAAPPTPAPARVLPVVAADDTIPFIDFPNTDIRDVLEFYETLTGKKTLFDNTVQGNIHVRVTRPVAKAEAVRILETVFALNSYTLIPGPGDIVKVINNTKNVRQFSIPIVSEVAQLPEGNQVVTFLFKLDYADPQEVQATLQQVIAPTNSVTNVLALPKSQAVLVTESADMLRSMAQIVAKLDTKPAEVVSEFFTLERADAAEVVQKLARMFEKTEGQTPGNTANLPPRQPSQNRQPGMPGAPGSAPHADAAGNAAASVGGALTLSEDSLIVGKIKIEADTRTNRVHVVTRPVNLPFLRRIIGELDGEIPAGEAFTRPLRFVRASQILDIIAGAVAEQGMEVKPLNASSAGGSSSSASAVNGRAGSFNNYGGNGSESGYGGGYGRGYGSSYGGYGGGYGSYGGGNRSSAGVTTQDDDPPTGLMLRNTKIIADNRINAIIIVGTEEMKSRVCQVIDQIDVRAPQVLLTAVIGELTLDDNEQFGIDYLYHHGNLSQLVEATGSGLGSGLGLPYEVPGMARANGINLKNLLTAASLPSTGGGVSAFIAPAKSLDLIVSALESTGRFRVTARPMIFTSNNRQATIISGERVPIPNTSSYANTGTVYNGADYMEIALRLAVRPLINTQGEVWLEIEQTSDNTSSSATVNGNSLPIVTNRSITTSVSVANEATVVLGGLVSEKKQDSRSGIPVLNRLPVVGPLFGFRKKSVTRTELIVLIRPTVTRGPVEAVRAGEKALKKTHFEPGLEASLDVLEKTGTAAKPENKPIPKAAPPSSPVPKATPKRLPAWRK